MVFRRAAVMLLGCLGIAYQPTKPSPAPPESTESPPLPPSSSVASSKPSSSTSSSDGDDVGVGELRIRLSDGRYLAYTERGVPKNKSKFRVIIVHGFGSSKEMSFVAPQVYRNLPYSVNFLIS